MLTDTLNDILAHTHGLGFIEMLKIVGDNNETKIEAMNEKKTVILYGTLKTPSEELVGTIGMARLAVLNGYLRFPPFQDDKATVEVVTDTRNGEEIPKEIAFKAPGGHSSSYRFMSAEVANEQIKVPVFRGSKWDVVVTPDEGNMKDLSYFAGILGAFEPVFVAKTEGSDLVLSIGSGSTDRARVPFAKGVSGSLAGRWAWPLVETLAILKLAAKASDCRMSFAEKGVMKIEVETAAGTYEYLLPAKSV